MDIIQLIADNNYLVVNKTLLKQYGAEAAVLLSELANEYSLCLQDGKLTDDGFFCSTVEDVQKTTTLSAQKQRAAIELLKKNGIIDVCLKGLPAKRHVKINMDGLKWITNNSVFCS